MIFILGRLSLRRDGQALELLQCSNTAFIFVLQYDRAIVEYSNVERLTSVGVSATLESSYPDILLAFEDWDRVGLVFWGVDNFDERTHYRLSGWPINGSIEYYN